MFVVQCSKRVLVGIAVAGLLAACSTAPRERTSSHSTERHYDEACESASRDIDTLMVHWENPRATERMPPMQITQVRQATRIIAPVCRDPAAAVMLDATARGRVDAAFRTIENAARYLPRIPAGG